jgi:hypothetical protein
MPASRNTTTHVEPGYRTPPFPSLYWLIGPPDIVKPAYLYHHKDIWRFTLFWTLIFLEAAHLLVGTYAVIIVWWGGRSDARRDGKGEKGPLPGRGLGGWRKLKVLWIVPVVYGLVAGLQAVLAGSVVGLM